MGTGRWGGRARDEKDPRTGRELRADITPAEKERLERGGSLSFRSPRDASRMSHAAAEKFIPSKEQH